MQYESSQKNKIQCILTNYSVVKSHYVKPKSSVKKPLSYLPKDTSLSTVSTPVPRMLSKDCPASEYNKSSTRVSCNTTGVLWDRKKHDKKQTAINNQTENKCDTAVDLSEKKEKKSRDLWAKVCLVSRQQQFKIWVFSHSGCFNKNTRSSTRTLDHSANPWITGKEIGRYHRTGYACSQMRLRKKTDNTQTLTNLRHPPPLFHLLHQFSLV